MALKECPHCGKKVCDTLEKCIHCQGNLKESPKTEKQTNVTRCPECGEVISAESKECKYCGCKVYVCPECKEAFKKDFSVCEKCGFSVNKLTEKQGEKINRLCEEHLKNNTLGIVGIILEVIAYVLMGIVVFQVALWIGDKPINIDKIEWILDSQELIDNGKTMLLCGCLIVAFVAFLKHIRFFVDAAKFSKLIGGEEEIKFLYDLINIDEIDLNIDLFYDGLEWISSPFGMAFRVAGISVCYQVDRWAKIKSFLLGMIPFAITCIGFICLAIGLQDVLETIVSSFAMGKKYSFNDFKYWYLIIAVLSFLLEKFLIKPFINEQRTSIHEKWLKKHAPKDFGKKKA